MKTSLEHLPESKRRRVEAIAELLQREPGVIMVILFGNFARGDGVEDPIGGYFSDFDILAIVGRSASAYAGQSPSPQARCAADRPESRFRSCLHRAHLGPW